MIDWFPYAPSEDDYIKIGDYPLCVGITYLYWSVQNEQVHDILASG